MGNGTSGWLLIGLLFADEFEYLFICSRAVLVSASELSVQVIRHFFFFFNLVVFFLFISENYILGNLVLYNECQIFSPHFVPLGLFLRNIPLAYLQGKDSADRLENPKMVL